MSAIAWEPLDGYAAAAPRPRLTLVPEPAPARRDPAAGLRITARGRLVLVLLAVLTVATVLGLRGLGGAGAAEPADVVTVQGGQTLSEIAAVELPGMSISRGVLAIQLANDLTTAQVRAGQQLVIPQG